MKFFADKLALCLLLMMLSACSASRFIPEGHYMLENVTVKSDDKKVDVSLLKGYIRQHPNAKWFSLIKAPMAPYLLSGRDTTRRINRFLQRIGEAPVIFDTVQANRSAENMLAAIQNMGYLEATISQQYQIKKQKLKLTYALSPGPRYRVSSLDYQIDDPVVDSLIMSDKGNSRLYSGMPFDVNVLDAERSRMSTLLQNNGYYKFNKEYVRYIADTCVGNYEVGLKVLIPLYRPSAQDSLRLHERYTVRQIAFVNNLGRMESSYDTTGVTKMVYNGYPFYYKGRLGLRPAVFIDNNKIVSGKYYSERDVQQTYANLGRLGSILYSNVRMEEVDTFSRQLDCYISVNQNRPRSFGAELEGTNSAGDLGAALSLSYQNRNLFRGSELLSVKLRGAFEAITGLEGYSDQNYFEISAEVGLTFPQFKLFHFGKKRHIVQPTSEISVLYDSQNRPEFHRRVLTSALRYRWRSPRELFRHRIDIIDLNYVFMPWISDTFRRDYLDDASDRNAILRYNYENLFIMKFGYSFSYNSQGGTASAVDYGSNALGLHFNIESSGNLLYGLSELFNTSKSNGQYTLFNIAYAQYVKGDVSLSKSFRFDSRNSLALHFGLGIAYPYGNSTILPYEKRYFSGGANSVRGWSVRGLGPGSFRGTDGRIDFINQTGDIKLDLNAEYRTKLFWKLHGAFFIDAGNIWTIREYAEQPGGQFGFDTFWRQIAVSYGLGLRLNFDFFVLRLDGGMKAVDPAYSDHIGHYPLLHPDFRRDFTLHFAVGLPF